MKKVICMLLTVVFGVSAAGADNDIRPNRYGHINCTKPHAELAVPSTADDDDDVKPMNSTNSPALTNFSNQLRLMSMNPLVSKIMTGLQVLLLLVVTSSDKLILARFALKSNLLGGFFETGCDADDRVLNDRAMRNYVKYAL